MKKVFILLWTLLLCGVISAQLSPAENYVYTKTYLTDPTGSNPKSVETVQYIDGLGRPKQIVEIKASPQQKDVVTHIVYDQFGRQSLDYLPVPQNNTGNGAFVSNPLLNVPNTPLGNEIIFSKKEFENSPLNRALQQNQVGIAWAGKPVKYAYDANADGEVKKYIASFNYSNFSSSITISPTAYSSGQLYKNTVTDEDGNKTIEFTDGYGRVILLRKKIDENAKADTYYVYNNYEQLAYVISPLAVAKNNVDESTLNDLCYQYIYDGTNLLVEKKVPGKGWEYMMHDKADRLVATQDAVMRKSGRWLFTKYDMFGRVLYTGTTIDNRDRVTVQESVINLYGTNHETSGTYTQSGLQIYYANTAYPQSIESILSVNYYDTYPFGAPAPPTQILGENVRNGDNQNLTTSTKSFLTASYIKNIEDDNWTKNYNWYDKKGRVIGTHSINHLGGYTKKESLFDFSGTPLQIVTRHKRLNNDTERVINENFTYDHQNRLLTHTHQVDNNPVEYLSQNEYDELSQLKTKKVGGTTSGSGLQTIDYKYNIQGWITEINNPTNLTGGDLFGYKIKYNEREGQETPNNDFTNLQVKPKFNGNIAEIDWRTATTAGDNLRRYGFVYDGLDRLLAGFYQKDTNPTAKEYLEKIDYDLNGNITNLQRSEGILPGSSTAMTIDNLNYAYSGNRLNSITDNSGQYSGYPDTSGAVIGYDSNGNMKNHFDKGIENLDYNYLNLPNYILFNFGIPTRGGIIKNNLSYLYRADGVKLKKIYNYAPENPFGTAQVLLTEVTDYIDGFQYKGNGKTGKGGLTSLLFYPTAEGYFDFAKNKYIYNYADHLGNIRLSYFHNGNSVEVLEENNYYPFGLKHEGYNPLAGNPNYQFKYQKQELQTETGWYGFKWRNYMPETGRFFNIDVLAEEYPTWSPYAFSGNRVIDARELEGLEPVLVGPGGIIIPPPPPPYGSSTTGMHPIGRMKPQWLDKGLENLKNNISAPSKLTTFIYTSASTTAMDIYSHLMKSEGESDSKSSEKSEDEGIVYKRKEKQQKEKDYVGQAKNDGRYQKRKKEHQRKNPDADYDFDILERGKAGKDLDRKEQKHIDEGGGPTNKSNPNGGLQNKRNQVKQPKIEPKEPPKTHG